MVSRSRSALPFVALLLVAFVAATCGGPSQARDPVGSGGPTDVPPSAPVGSASPASSAAPGASIDPATPMACLTLDPADCARARDLAATELTPADPVPIYVQVGPFGCSVGDTCPLTLGARPEGDVVIEFAGGAGVNVHLVVGVDGVFSATRSEPMGVPVEPTSPAGIGVGASPFRLGHCGLLSGIDAGGSWWDPVGPVAMDSGEAVNETDGVLTVTDADNATFATAGGFTVQLRRRDGAKLLPFCM